ncbi:MAG: hypothetical protein CXZ00_05690 [Acidobacteria bacterium]|nr:MAG: hypothetical protein CXZ00_05690 [Acidobacteriota bacterium]
MKRLRRSTETEVIAEFLKNEFYQEEFHADRHSFKELVIDADLTDEAANALRRALLFRRRGHMWRELPPDTQWYEVELEPDDLKMVRVFPRAPWRKLAGNNLLLRDIVHRIRTVRFSGSTREFVADIQALSSRLNSEHNRSAILLIGVDEEKPLTILEGNHRLTAALLAGPAMFSHHFRVFCGFSPLMNNSCWYATNLPNLWRYGQNRLRNLFYDRDADISRVLRNLTGIAKTPELDGAVKSICTTESGSSPSTATSKN